jgi:hypothetical protein
VQVVHRPLHTATSCLLVDVQLTARVCGEEPEEPGQRRRRRVLARQHDAHHHVAQESVLRHRRREHGAELAAAILILVHGRREPREQVWVPVFFEVDLPTSRSLVSLRTHVAGVSARRNEISRTASNAANSASYRRLSPAPWRSDEPSTLNAMWQMTSNPNRRSASCRSTPPPRRPGTAAIDVPGARRGRPLKHARREHVRR